MDMSAREGSLLQGEINVSSHLNSPGAGYDSPSSVLEEDRLVVSTLSRDVGESRGGDEYEDGAMTPFPAHYLILNQPDIDDVSKRSDIVTSEKPFSLKEMHAITETMGIVGFKPAAEVAPNMRSKSSPRLRTSKTIVITSNADIPHFRPDVKRTAAVGLDAVLDGITLMRIKPLLRKPQAQNDSFHYLGNKPQLTEREQRFAEALSPTPYTKFHSHESKEAREEYMKQLLKLRRYKLGLSPEKRARITAGDIFTGPDVAQSSQYASNAGGQDLQSTGLDGMHDDDWEELARNARFYFDDGTPKGLSASLSRSNSERVRVELTNTKMKRTATKPWTHFIDKSASVKKTLVVKPIPEHKMECFRRADSKGIPASIAPLKAVPAETILNERASSPPREYSTSYRPQSRGLTPMTDSFDCQDINHGDLKANVFPNWNNPLQRSRMDINKATRVAARDYVKCCQCSKGSCFWCDQCSLSYCRDCWSSVPHHAYIEEHDLPLPPPALHPANDLATHVFPALAKSKNVSKNFSETILRKSGTNFKPHDKASAFDDDHDAPFELVGDQSALRAKEEGKKSSNGNRRGRSSKKQSKDAKPDMNSPKIKDSSRHQMRAPVLSVGQSLGGGAKLSMGFSGAVSKNKKAIVGITSELFPEDWRESREHADISVYDGVPVYVNPNRERSSSYKGKTA
jgi:hypothetical protein